MNLAPGGRESLRSLSAHVRVVITDVDRNQLQRWVVRIGLQQQEGSGAFALKQDGRGRSPDRLRAGDQHEAVVCCATA